MYVFRTTELQAGDHVTVTSGAYSGRRGTVVKVKSKVCFVFDEVAQEEFEVFARDLSSTAAKVTANADRYKLVYIYTSCWAALMLYVVSHHLAYVCLLCTQINYITPIVNRCGVVLVLPPAGKFLLHKGEVSFCFLYHTHGHRSFLVSVTMLTPISCNVRQDINDRCFVRRTNTVTHSAK